MAGEEGHATWRLCLRSILHLTSGCQWKTNTGHVSLRPYKGVLHMATGVEQLSVRLHRC